MTNQQEPQGRQFIPISEVARHFDVSEMTIRRMCDRGEIPGARKIGRQWRIPRSYLSQPQAA